MLSLDYEVLAGEVLRLLRGPRSQVAFSRRLRYKSNVAYLWESGRHWPTAATSLWAASRVGIDPLKAVAEFYRTPPSWLGDADLTKAKDVARLLDDLRGNTPILEIAKRTDRSRFAISRWLKGKTEPRLPDFLRLIEATSQRLLDFLSRFVDVEQLDSAKTAWQQLQAARAMIGRLPWSPAVLLVLETEDYLALPRHEEGWIANRLGLPREVERECIDLLATSGQIQMVQERWRVVRVQTIDTRADPNAGHRLKEWWAQVGLESIRNRKPGVFSFNIFSVSNSDFERLETMHRNHYRAMRAIIAASKPAQRVCATNLQLFALDGAISDD